MGDWADGTCHPCPGSLFFLSPALFCLFRWVTLCVGSETTKLVSLETWPFFLLFLCQRQQNGRIAEREREKETNDFPSNGFIIYLISFPIKFDLSWLRSLSPRQKRQTDPMKPRHGTLEVTKMGKTSSLPPTSLWKRVKIRWILISGEKVPFPIRTHFGFGKECGEILSICFLLGILRARCAGQGHKRKGHKRKKAAFCFLNQTKQNKLISFGLLNSQTHFNFLLFPVPIQFLS